MTVEESPALATALPEAGTWDFGDHLYGLEPLALPAEPPRPDPSAPGDEEQPLREQRELADRVARWRAAPDLAADLIPADTLETERVFWFRWITGHQTTFILWQLLAPLLDEHQAPETGPEHRRWADAAARRARCLIRCFSLMLLYTSSPPRDIYERVIRNPMARQHAHLSGAWAKDYGPVRPLVRGRISLGGAAEAAALAEECVLNEKVHEGISAKVMETGVSLLLTPHERRETPPMARDTRRWLYDQIFLTTRLPVSHDDLVRQLLRRVHTILLDFTACGLYPDYAPSAQDEPPGLLTPEIRALKESFADTLRELIGHVGLPHSAHRPASRVS
ncbi:L-tyrosine 3-hydroxylase [Streptomyces tubercidicus]|uniref:L-tyrosine 3-hydroxylase n=1 Tax=Streptomyces tubercidicus TaxID=47759 RepID=UPI0030DE4C60